MSDYNIDNTINLDAFFSNIEPEKRQRETSTRLTADQWIEQNPMPVVTPTMQDMLDAVKMAKAVAYLSVNLNKRAIALLVKHTQNPPEQWVCPKLAWATTDPAPGLIFDGVCEWRDEATQHDNLGVQVNGLTVGTLYCRVWVCQYAPAQGNKSKFRLRNAVPPSRKFAQIMQSRNIETSEDELDLPARLVFPLSFSKGDLEAYQIAAKKAKEAGQPMPETPFEKEARLIGAKIDGLNRDVARVINAIVTRQVEVFCEQKNADYNQHQAMLKWVINFCRANSAGAPIAVPNGLSTMSLESLEYSELIETDEVSTIAQMVQDLVSDDEAREAMTIQEDFTDEDLFQIQED